MSFREVALSLFDREWPEGRARRKPVRLVGFGVANFQDDSEGDEPSLFDTPDDERRRRHERLSETLDALRDKGLMA